ncbi:hypothetical protein ACVXG7_24485 [Enterobacter hormaechei]
MKAFQQLNDGEQKTVTELILRDGIRSFLENICQRLSDFKERAIALSATDI